MVDLHNPHDALFNATFEDPRLAEIFFHENLPNRIAQHLDYSRPEKIDGSFFDEVLAGSQCDALFRVRTKKTGDPVYMYVLLEHKSTPEPDLPLQLSSYTGRIWKRHVKENGPASLRALPPIIPMVLYTGQRHWNVPKGLGEMISGEPDLCILPGELYILSNLKETPSAKLSGDAELKSVLTTMKFEAMESLALVLNSLTPELRRQVLHYIVGVYEGVELEGILAALRLENANEMEDYVGTIAETLLAEGKAHGMVAGEAKGMVAGEAKGMVAGEAKGLVKGKAETLLRLMERRFGPLPRKHRQRIAAAKIEQIEKWFDAAIDAPDMETVFMSETRH